VLIFFTVINNLKSPFKIFLFKTWTYNSGIIFAKTILKINNKLIERKLLKGKQQMSFSKFASTSTALVLSTSLNAATIYNGSFEMMNFTHWIPSDINEPYDPLTVAGAGAATEFYNHGPNFVLPSDGDFAMNNGFDGGGPGAISLAQDVGIISAGEVLTFDYRAGWDLVNFPHEGGSLDRFFEVSIETAGGGATVGTHSIITAFYGTDTLGNPNSDTGPLSASIDLSSYAGLDARINFLWTVPEYYSGPANAQLDNVSISSVPVPAAVWLFSTGLITLIGAAKRKKSRT